MRDQHCIILKWSLPAETTNTMQEQLNGEDYADLYLWVENVLGTKCSCNPASLVFR
jgi:hypothetical protein